MAIMFLDNKKRGISIDLGTAKSPRKMKRRRVEFTPHVAIIPITSAQDSTFTWYDCENYDEFKRQAVAISQKKSLSSLSCVFDKTVFTSKSADQGILNFWTIHVEEARGLESIINPTLARARRATRAKCVQAVLVAQCIAQHDDAMQPCTKGKLIAIVSSQHSSKAKAFAHMMGKADKIAVEFDAIPKFNEIVLSLEEDVDSTSVTSLGLQSKQVLLY